MLLGWEVETGLSRLRLLAPRGTVERLNRNVDAAGRFPQWAASSGRFFISNRDIAFDLPESFA